MAFSDGFIPRLIMAGYLVDEDGNPITGEDGYPIDPDTDIPTDDDPSGDDVIIVVDDPGGTPGTKKLKIEDLLTGLNDVVSMVSAYNSIDIEAREESRLPLDSEDWDTDSWHSTATNTEQFVCPASGIYMFVLNNSYDVQTFEASCTLGVEIGGFPYEYVVNENIAIGEVNVQSAMYLSDMDPDDISGMYSAASSGTYHEAESDYSPRFQIIRVA